MRRLICGGALLLVLAGLTLGDPSAASATSAGVQKHVRSFRCTGTATGHKKITKGDVTTCNSSSLRVTRPCPQGSSTIFVLVHNRTYVLRIGHVPKRLPKQYGMGTISQACGIPAATSAAPAAPTTIATTVAPVPVPTTTTTAPPPPPATVPPPTTAAPASCQPLTDGGNCYEPGEFCRDSDHGVTGVAGDGKTITCEDNDGWRWEPT
jgi:hypothetical protein